ncbi:hypothetical protein B9Z55_020175 [Caenorhabditis nigoni]|uniref:Uncharacterized protein n=1 Tax=Caenorhabditis nigoni TaxID=1611254 RepID=A0A2G5TM34_9PELO|nr:hypothetical protein B9Z55_020175 [Caenorhabditis nigoni]
MGDRMLRWNGLDWRLMRTTWIRMAQAVTTTRMVIGHQLVRSQEIEDDNNSATRKSTVEHQIGRVVIR